ncbi:nuclear transport factor 2 family protein [Roseivirga sp.]|uniref:nuclear transport factor 2 family protein n=1 Tax=Roseivirga sp. TaxID=1964215 RepID=UPI003BAA7067
MTYKERTQDIYNMIGRGQLLEAFDKYYANNVVMTEPRGSWEGKDACRAHEVEFLSYVKEFHNLEVKSITSDEENGVVMHETMMDVTFQDGNRAQMEQVGVQKWEGDQIVHERFYYDNAQ